MKAKEFIETYLEEGIESETMIRYDRVLFLMEEYYEAKLKTMNYEDFKNVVFDNIINKMNDYPVVELKSKPKPVVKRII